jgi:hypothetical protein
LAGATFLAGFNYALSKLYNNPTLTFKLLVQTLYALNVVQLIPTTSPTKSDGYYIFKKFDVSENTLDALQTHGEIPCIIAIGLAFLALPVITTISQRATFKTE